MEKFGRNAPLPHEMQGHWKDADGDEDETDLIIEEGEVYYLGQHVDYDCPSSEHSAQLAA